MSSGNGKESRFRNAGCPGYLVPGLGVVHSKLAPLEFISVQTVNSLLAFFFGRELAESHAWNSLVIHKTRITPTDVHLSVLTGVPAVVLHKLFFTSGSSSFAVSEDSESHDLAKVGENAL